jgi:hypothetical protein
MAGSEKRKRNHAVTYRLDDAEYDEIKARAGDLSLASYSRLLVLGTTPPKGSRRAPADKKELARILATLGRLNGNINQLAKHANIERSTTPDAQAIVEALAEIKAMREDVMKALGKGR